MSLGTRLKELRLGREVSLQAVADSVGASKPHIWELERGTTKNPSIDLLKKLAMYYDVSLDYLAELKDREELDIAQTFARQIADKNLTEGDRKALLSLAEVLSRKNGKTGTD
ncbi:helix-turn-helix transcriptional regulator [Candidatus Thiothrix sp. Deng01]|uniref:Helix-turn-helix transcriptional regulator n=1 Tax=Candidatus Thiothrix phosphatis TaxID=3112415 RepID=A0ABU6CRM7_9GAMM|nr:helix-turn-helix transcriptional regulator [Candidatus Thiothrix sp. Deng01]MEB4589500.1 helix-turn-helix transcriptional regulator [Candidatus Thiothrix sp. Deng01]